MKTEKIIEKYSTCAFPPVPQNMQHRFSWGDYHPEQPDKRQVVHQIN